MSDQATVLTNEEFKDTLLAFQSSNGVKAITLLLALDTSHRTLALRLAEAQEQLRLANIDAAQNEARANDAEAQIKKLERKV